MKNTIRFPIISMQFGLFCYELINARFSFKIRNLVKKTMCMHKLTENDKDKQIKMKIKQVEHLAICKIESDLHELISKRIEH